MLTRVCCTTVCELCYLCATLRNSCIDVSHLIILCDLASMPRLSDSDRNRIIGEIRAGIKPSEVALRYNVHRSAVYRLMNKFTQDGDVVDRPRSGRPRVRRPSGPRNADGKPEKSIQISCRDCQGHYWTPWTADQRPHCTPEAARCRAVFGNSGNITQTPAIE